MEIGEINVEIITMHRIGIGKTAGLLGTLSLETES
jgi:hypothetical protein